MDEPSRAGARTRSGSLLGRCEHCEWSVVVGSHSAVVEAYQNHLREEHNVVTQLAISPIDGAHGQAFLRTERPEERTRFHLRMQR